MSKPYRLKEFKLDKKGVGNLLRSDEMLDLVRRTAEQYVDADRHVKAFKGFDRARAIVYPNTKENPG